MINGGHPDLGELGPELRRLAQAILDGIDPAVRAAAALASASSSGEPGKCQQVWCPVCALAALATGEEHPLLTVIAEHSTTLLAVIRAALNDPPTADDRPPPGPPGGTGATGYQPIPVVVEK